MTYAFLALFGSKSIESASLFSKITNRSTKKTKTTNRSMTKTNYSKLESPKIKDDPFKKTLTVNLKSKTKTLAYFSVDNPHLAN